MRTTGLVLGLACAVGILAGCGGSGGAGGTLPPNAPAVETGEVTVGPFVMRPAAATSMQVESLPVEFGASFAVFSGVTIDYVAVRELMDRIVFVSTRNAGKYQLFTCDFFGDNPTQITFNNRVDTSPAWSPDGTKLAWTYDTATLGEEILVRPAAGGAATHLTNSIGDDNHATWSPDGRWIAFDTSRECDIDIYKMLADGSNQMPLTVDTHAGPDDYGPAWAPDESKILFASNRDGNDEIYIMDATGANQQRLTTNSNGDRMPAWHPNGSTIAYGRWWATGTRDWEIYTNNESGSNEQLFVTGIYSDDCARYSGDGRHLLFASFRTMDWELWAKQTSPPYRLYQITNSPGLDYMPDLGSPTVQISRVLIGPAGSDHGYDPVHDAAVAGVVAFNTLGYLNFVRLGVPPASGPSLTATPVENAGMSLVGVVLSAPNMYYVEEDAGVGTPTIMWDFTGATSRTAALYFNAHTGKLVTVIDVGDSIHSASADGMTGLTHEQAGSTTIARGEFRRVWNADGELVAEGEIGAVEIDATRCVVRAY